MVQSAVCPAGQYCALSRSIAAAEIFDGGGGHDRKAPRPEDDHLRV
jgi:hypothetical protein